MHSHGNINRILPRLVETGIDMLNPLDQDEGMHLAAIKDRYGQRLTLVGGMDKFIYEQDLPEIERRLRRSVEIGRRGGRYILMDTGGVPETISREKIRGVPGDQPPCAGTIAQRQQPMRPGQAGAVMTTPAPTCPPG